MSIGELKNAIDSLDDSLRSRADGGQTILGAIEQQTEAITRLADIIESLCDVYFEVVGYPEHAKVINQEAAGLVTGSESSTKHETYATPAAKQNAKDPNR